MIYTLLVSAIITFGLAWCVRTGARRRIRPPLPPSPPSDPIIGHLRIIPAKDAHEFFYTLSKQYGKVISLRIPGSTIIVLNSMKAAVDLLDKKSAIYSDRPQSHVMSLMGWINSLTFLPYGNLFMTHRRLMNDYLHSTKCLSYTQYQTNEARRMVYSMKENPEEFSNVLSRFSAGTLLRIVYGHQLQDNDDLYIKILSDASDCVRNCATPGGNLVDLIPILQHFPSWFPGTYPATQARESKSIIDKLYEAPFEDISRQLREGTSLDSFMATHVEGLQREGIEYPYKKEDIKGAAATMCFAGSDTTWATLVTFILAMVLYPSVQREAQEELDRAIGTDRLPTFDDRSHLPYLEGVVQECYRWHNSAPTGIAHRVIEDDIYNGMFIPKGSVVVANTRGITLDEDVYKEPQKFDPSRYRRGEPHPLAHFGFGRRICPGRHFADATIWIGVASILSQFDITPVVDDEGIKVLPKEEFDTGTVSHPKPFKCCIKTRRYPASVIQRE